MTPPEHKEIVFVSGSRAEFGQVWELKQTVEGILNSQDNCSLVIVGELASDISGGLFENPSLPNSPGVDVVETLLASNNSIGIAKSVGLGIASLADYFKLKRATKVVLFGDRFEMYAAGMAASLLEIETVHLHGGEVTGAKFDNFFRTSLSLLSSLHLVSTDTHAQNLKAIGIPEANIQIVGSVGAANAHAFRPWSRAVVENRLGIDLIEPTIVVAFHPEIPSDFLLEEQIDVVLGSLDLTLSDLGTVILSGSNSDWGGREVSKRFEEFALINEKAYFFQSVGQELFWSLLNHSGLLIGNSSAGLIEAPMLGIPIVDVGSRQRGRTRSSAILHVPLEVSELASAIRGTVSEKKGGQFIGGSNPYFKENTISRIASAIVG